MFLGHTEVKGTYQRDPADLLRQSILKLLFRRRSVKYQNQQEWDDITEAIVLLDSCLKKVVEECQSKSKNH